MRYKAPAFAVGSGTVSTDTVNTSISTSRNTVKTPEARPKGAFAGGLLWGCGWGTGTRGASGHRPVGGVVDWARSWAYTTGQKQSPCRPFRPFHEVLSIVTASLIGLTLLLTSCGDEEPQPTPSAAPIRVRVQEVVRAEVPVALVAVGTTQPFAHATASTRLMGDVVEADFNEGQRVEKGQVLVRLESRALQAQRAQAQAALAAARAAREHAETALGRLGNLFAEEAISRQALDDAETAYARSEAMEKAARQGVRQADAQLRYDAVKAPLSGYIVRKFMQVGDMASPGAPLFTIEQLDPLKVEVALPEREREHVNTGDEVIVEIEALGLRVKGQMQALVQQADPRSRSFRAKIVVDNADGRIGSGMFARVLFAGTSRTVLMVSAEALVHKGQLQGVYVVSDGLAHLRWLRLGKRYGERIEVFSGLDAGEQVVVAPTAELREGSRVEVRSDG